ncbi:hypothetical protein NLX85_06125 [Micromonospora sp. A3M-1-15]|uniref:hypothetical protein n=1 Tax=Micromonospora sp. A3M-1-15 TaxID=2962035 RepID=UPI0020B6BE9A|nr:hypothetical protein [Micromonospora sp. A3M-1-15]MCP3782941.1 hypothetical protein [Micromonospora sp. A3M-1-15]
MAPKRRLAPGQVAQVLFGLDPDRDERAPQLCAETLLTLAQNGYRAPAAGAPIQSPKRQRFALRSLALATNFLGGREGRAGEDNMTPQLYGDLLAKGSEVRNSANLTLAQNALQGLVDPDTQRGQPGAWLLRPFHESLLWYDARKASPSRADWTVRKVYMRGSGITLARLLLDPGDPESAALGARAVEAIKEALTGPSPLAEISERLESALPTDATYTSPPDVEEDEKEAWERGRDKLLQPLAASICRHAEGVMCQGGASGPAKLWQLRTILALDLAVHALRVAWETTSTPEEDRFLLLSFGRGPRAQDRVRQRSEESYRRARIRLNEATISTLARRMRELVGEKTVAWDEEFEKRSRLVENRADSVSHQLTQLTADSPDEEFLRLARTSVENANYGRAEDGFRVLLESVGLIAGTRYRYLTATPDLLAALVGALSSRMPMPSNEFFAAIRQEWGLVINQESAASTSLRGQVDGAGLERNARRAEQLMSEAGLALSLSDRTTVVGERAQRWGK